jgi:hypothetical protein
MLLRNGVYNDDVDGKPHQGDFLPFGGFDIELRLGLVTSVGKRAVAIIFLFAAEILVF